MATVSLETLFANSEQQLREKLSNLTVPKDTEKIQSIISEHFSNLLIEEGDFRQNLTQSEDYILEAAISLLNAQQKISSALIKDVGSTASKKNASIYYHTGI